MDTLLWILQFILALKLFSVAYSHGLRQDQTKMQEGIRRMGTLTKPVLYAVAFCSFLIGIGLILPAVEGVPHWPAPLAAAILAGMMLLSIIFHRACRGKPNILPSLVLLVLAALAAYGRWAIAPL